MSMKLGRTSIAIHVRGIDLVDNVLDHLQAPVHFEVAPDQQ